jgi:riboflavin kinase, archaea type
MPQEEIKLQHILTIVELLSRGARHNFVEITSSELGKRIGRSQQAASKHLLELENSGYLERTKRGQKFAVRITEKGIIEIQGLYSSLRSAIESSPTTMHFEGSVASGMGEGAYYMSLQGYRRQFKEKLGYEPYPGTLNVRLVDQVYMNARRDLGVHQPSAFVDGYSDGTRTYGWVKCYKARINENSAIPDAAVLVLERTHYDDTMLEVIAPVPIKQKLALKNGDTIRVDVQIPQG